MQLYIHVPFCKSKCNYCTFYSVPLSETGQEEMTKIYIENLIAELSLWSERLGNTNISTIFFGGGTPSLLPSASVAKIMNAIRKKFSVDSAAEISFEGNPESMLKFGYADELVKSGINRLSLGIQSLDDYTLRFMGRVHSAREALAAYDTARVCGFRNISLDFIWGLPGQRLRSWLEDLKMIVDLKPDHLSCYNLTIESGSKFAKMADDGELSLPDDKEQAAMYGYGTDFLKEKGYLHYEISNYARMGFKCAHNLGYWEGADYIGIGPAATSTLKERRWTNPSNLKLWADEVSKKEIGANHELLDHTTRVIEMIMLRLRTEKGLRLQDYRKLTGRDFVKDNKQLIQALHGKGMVRILNGYLSLTTTGMLVSNSILEYLFSATRDHLASGNINAVDTQEDEILDADTSNPQ